jgi:hypothetical protein
VSVLCPALRCVVRFCGLKRAMELSDDRQDLLAVDVRDL